jgi:hypothetical protein
MLAALVLVAAGSAAAQDRAQGAALLDAAAATGMDEAQTVKLYQAYQGLRSKLVAARETRAAAHKALREALDAGAADADLAAKLDALRLADAALAQLHQTGPLEVASGLTPAQQAQVYLALGPGGGAAERGGVRGGRPAPAAPAAPAAAPEVPLEEQAMAMVQQWVGAAKSKDIDAMMKPFADNYYNAQLGDKQGARDFLKNAMDMGYLDGIEVSMEDAEVELDNGKASIYPVDVDGPFGSVTIEFIAEQVDGTWKLVGLDITGI